MEMQWFEKWVANQARRSVVGALALLVSVAMLAQTAAGQEGVRRLLEALWIDIPARPSLAPPFAVPGLDGAQVRLSDLQGRVVMLYFWTTW